MKTILQHAKRLAKQETAIKRRDQRLAQLAAEQEQDRVAAAAAREQLALAVLRERGLIDLPAEQLVTLLSGLGNTTATAVQGAIIAAAPPLQAEEPGEQEPPAMAQAVVVTVQISRNAAKIKRKALKAAGVKWNGKRECWRGTVDRCRVGALRAMFGERLTLSAPPVDREPAATGTGAEPSVVTIGDCAQTPADAADVVTQVIDGDTAVAGPAEGVVAPSGEGPAAAVGYPQTGVDEEGTAQLPPVRPRAPARPVLPGRAQH